MFCNALISTFFKFYKRLAEEESAGCFVLVVFLLPYGYKCFASLTCSAATDWSMVSEYVKRHCFKKNVDFLRLLRMQCECHIKTMLFSPLVEARKTPRIASLHQGPELQYLLKVEQDLS